jgi:hypothetical protein
MNHNQRPLLPKNVPRFFLSFPIGKRGRHVPILLSDVLCEAIELLNENRIAVGVPDTVEYLFGKPNSETYLKHCAEIRKFADNCGLERPDLIRTTDLRKHLATSIQVLNLKENEIDWVARFLVSIA